MLPRCAWPRLLTATSRASRVEYADGGYDRSGWWIGARPVILLSLSRHHRLLYWTQAGAQVTLVSLPFVLLIPLLGSIVVAALRVTSPAVPTTTRVLAFALIALGPPTWVCVATWGHLEQPLMLCFLVAAVAALHLRREALAGVLAGLALLSGTAALFPLAALVALLVVQRQWRAVALVGGLATLVVVLGLAPFLVVDRRDTVYSLLTWRGSEQIDGNSLWSVFSVDAVARALPRSLDAVLRRLDTPSIIALAVCIAVLAARRLRVSAYSPEVWAVLAIAALGLPMLAKVMWPYYYFQPFVLLVIYTSARRAHDIARARGVGRCSRSGSSSSRRPSRRTSA